MGGDGMSSLTDRFGRVHRDLRISLTDRCSLRCTYCMPADGVPWLARSTMLTTDEIVRVARVGVEHGITEIRLTGGEPLLRVDVVDVVRRLTALTGPAGSPDVSLTTNALRLPALASPLRDAGLPRVNTSLAPRARPRFIEPPRRDRLVETLAGIAAADAAGLTPVKINAVAMRGVNDDEVVALTRFAVDRGYQMRFIEQMPLDGGHTWDRAEMVTQAEILSRLTSAFTLTEVPGRGAAPAELWTVDGGPATVGVIASVTHRSAARATGSGSRPTASCAPACSRRRRPTSASCCAAHLRRRVRPSASGPSRRCASGRSRRRARHPLRTTSTRRWPRRSVGAWPARRPGTTSATRRSTSRTGR